MKNLGWNIFSCIWPSFKSSSLKGKRIHVENQNGCKQITPTMDSLVSGLNRINCTPKERHMRRALIGLKKGAYLLKNGRRGKAKICPFRLSNDESVLIWLSGNKEKRLKLNHVSGIISGQQSPTFQRYPIPDKEYRSFSLIYKDRSLDLICKDKAEAEVWFSGLKALISSQQRKCRTDSRSDDIPSEASSPEGYTRRSSRLNSPSISGDSLQKDSSDNLPIPHESPSKKGLDKLCSDIMFTVPESRIVSCETTPISTTTTPALSGLMSSLATVPSQEVTRRLRAQVETLTRKAHLQEVELERAIEHRREALGIAGEETAKRKAAKEVIMSLTAQMTNENLNDSPEDMHLHRSDPGNFSFHKPIQRLPFPNHYHDYSNPTPIDIDSSSSRDIFSYNSRNASIQHLQRSNAQLDYPHSYGCNIVSDPKATSDS